jgi:hypothetical protein
MTVHYYVTNKDGILDGPVDTVTNQIHPLVVGGLRARNARSDTLVPVECCDTTLGDTAAEATQNSRAVTLQHHNADLEASRRLASRGHETSSSRET